MSSAPGSPLNGCRGNSSSAPRRCWAAPRRPAAHGASCGPGGVVLLAGAMGSGRTSTAGCCGYAPKSKARSRPIHCVVPGYRSQADHRVQLDTLAGVVARGLWDQPRARPVDSGADRRELRAWLRREDRASLAVSPTLLIQTPPASYRPSITTSSTSSPSSLAPRVGGRGQLPT
jgi:hypothetical protein